MTSRLLTIEEAALFLNISKTTLRRWTKSGRLPCSRIGVKGERRFLEADLHACISTFESSKTLTPLSNISGPIARLDAAAISGVPRHVCLHFHDRDELWEQFREYVLEQLKHGAPILYIHEESSRADVCSRIRAEGYDPEQLEREGTLRLLVPANSYLKSAEFVPERMVDFMEAAILAFRSAGHEKVLISGEMSWYLKGTPGVEKMIEYEVLLNKLLQRYPSVTIVCHYDASRLGGSIVLGALCSHPHAQFANRLVSGFYSDSHW